MWPYLVSERLLIGVHGVVFPACQRQCLGSPEILLGLARQYLTASSRCWLSLLAVDNGV